MLQRAVAGATKSATAVGSRLFSSIPPFHIAVPVHDLEAGTVSVDAPQQDRI